MLTEHNTNDVVSVYSAIVCLNSITHLKSFRNGGTESDRVFTSKVMFAGVKYDSRVKSMAVLVSKRSHESKSKTAYSL